MNEIKTAKSLFDVYYITYITCFSDYTEVAIISIKMTNEPISQEISGFLTESRTI